MSLIVKKKVLFVDTLSTFQQVQRLSEDDVGVWGVGAVGATCYTILRSEFDVNWPTLCRDTMYYVLCLVFLPWIFYKGNHGDCPLSGCPFSIFHLFLVPFSFSRLHVAGNLRFRIRTTIKINSQP